MKVKYETVAEESFKSYGSIPKDLKVVEINGKRVLGRCAICGAFRFADGPESKTIYSCWSDGVRTQICEKCYREDH